MRYLLDTDWLLDVTGGNRGASLTVERLRPHGLGVSIISHGELFEGAFNVPGPGSRLHELYDFLFQFTTLYLSAPIMAIFGRTRHELRRTGRRIEDFDLLIGATTAHLDLIVLTRNVRHFERIPSVRLYQAS